MSRPFVASLQPLSTTICVLTRFVFSLVPSLSFLVILRSVLHGVGLVVKRSPLCVYRQREQRLTTFRELIG